MPHEAPAASSDGDRPPLARGGDADLLVLVETIRRAFEAPLSSEQARAVSALAEQAARAIRRARAGEARRADLEIRDEILRRLARERAKTRRVLSAAGAGLWECRLGDERLDWSPQVYDLFGFRPGARLYREDTIGCYAPASRLALDKARAAALTNGGTFRLDAEIETARGERRWIRLDGVAELEDGAAVRLYGVKQDITEQRAEIEAARRLADTDALTGLANRRQFERLLARLAPAPGAGLALIDLDGFKQINDTFGHLTGDECLKETGRRLAATARGAALVARIGGDEFAVIFEGGFERAELEGRLRRITEGLRMPVSRGDFALVLGASAGLALSDGGASQDWVRRADLALYAAKAQTRGDTRGVEQSLPAPAAAFGGQRVAI